MAEFIYVGGNVCKHTGKEPVMIGGFPVHLCKVNEIDIEVLDTADLIISLNGDIPRGMFFGQSIRFVNAMLTDFGGVPKEWNKFIEVIANELREGKKIVAYCTGSHGRTGTFGASLIALMEPECENPLKAIRERHCKNAVESLKQVEAIWAVRDQTPPKEVVDSFTSHRSTFQYNVGQHNFGYQKSQQQTPKPKDSKLVKGADGVWYNSFKPDKRPDNCTFKEDCSCDWCFWEAVADFDSKPETTDEFKKIDWMAAIEIYKTGWNLDKDWDILAFRAPKPNEYYLSSTDGENIILQSNEDMLKNDLKRFIVVCKPLDEPKEVIISKEIDWTSVDGVKDIYTNGITVPDGYKIVDFRQAKKGELFLDRTKCSVLLSNFVVEDDTKVRYPRLIVEEVTEPKNESIHSHPENCVCNLCWQHCA